MNQTSLFNEHLAANAKMVDFHGWEMPLHYGSQLEEHQCVRESAGVFDVSHMTVVDILGAGGRQFLRHLLANDVDNLPHPGKALYSCMLNHRGGILDDLIVYFRTPDNYRLVLNSAMREADLEWLQRQSQGLSLGIQERTDLSILAVQGPQAIEKTIAILPPSAMDAASTLQPFETVDCDEWLIARTGYTGEDGLEIILPHEQAIGLWQSLLENGVKPCGLGARDTLRLEAGFLLYGQDMDATTTPYESGLGWTVSTRANDRDFIGQAALALQKEQGVKRQFKGLVLRDKGIIRNGQRVILDDTQEGVVTSGGYSPTLAGSIAMARLPVTEAKTCQVEIRGKLVTADIVKPRFVKHGKSII